MNTSGEAAEQVVRLSLEGVEVAAKIAGSSAKEIAVLLYTISKSKNQSVGKTKLLNLLKTGKELKIFTIKQEDLKNFSEKAKDYGILYSALINKKTNFNDGMVDIVVKAEDAARINRIVDRFKLSSYDETSIRGNVESKKKEVLAKNKKTKTNEEIIALEDEKKNLKVDDKSLNPCLAKTVKSPQLEPLLKTQENLDQGTRAKSFKTSIKKKLDIFKEEVKIRDAKEQDSKTVHTQPKRKKEKRSNERKH